MDRINITMIEDSEVITITGEEFDDRVKQCIQDLVYKQKENNNIDPFVGFLYATAYTALRRKLFKEN